VLERAMHVCGVQAQRLGRVEIIQRRVGYRGEMNTRVGLG
jgi:hypothetical protein